MTRTIYRKFILIFFGILLCASNILFAQISIKSEAPSVVSMNEMFQLKITANASLNDLKLPPINDFKVVTNMHSTSNINGKVSYVLILGMVPKSVGKFVIGEITITDNDGNIYKTDPITVEVIQGEGGEAPPKSSTNAQANKASSDNDAATDIFVRVVPSRTSLYRGDNLTVSVKVYRNPQVGLSGYDGFKLPAYNGFWSKDVDLGQQRWERENVGGKVYETMLLKRNILYPQQSGALKIEPFEATWIINKKTGYRSFFYEDFEEVRKTTKSPVVTINVKDLPGAAPESFTGAVGKFSMTASLSKQKVVANDAISLTIKITGNGNLALIDAPKINLPPDFDMFDSKRTESGNTISFEYPMIPRTEGNFTIEPIVFSYFDPASEKYLSLKSNTMTIEVDKDPNTNNTVFMTNPTNKRDVTILNSDIRFIKSKIPRWHKKGSLLFGLPVVYPIYLVLLVLFVLAFLWLKKRNKDSKNLLLVRNRKAKSIAKKRLKIATKLLKLNSAAGFYEELLKAIWGYVSDKFLLPVSDLSRDNICELLLEKNVDQSDIDKLIGIVDECEFARYAPGKSSTQMRDLYDNTVEVLSKLEQTTNHTKNNKK